MAKYLIQKGDTLSALALKYGSTVADLQKLNPSIKNPNLIYAGSALNVPDTTTPPPKAVEKTEPPLISTSGLRQEYQEAEVDLPKLVEKASSPQAPAAPTVPALDIASLIDEDDDEPFAKALAEASSFYQGQIEQTNQLLANFSAGLDKSVEPLISNIQATFARRKAQAEEIGRREAVAYTTFGYRTGGLRYAPTIAQGIVSEVERQTLDQLADLDVQEASAIQQAVEAKNNQQYEILLKMSDRILDLRKQKISEITNLYQMALDVEKETRYKQAEARQQAQFEAQEQERAFQRIIDLSNEQRKQFNSILDVLGGINVSTLSPQDQQAILDSGEQAGVPSDIVLQFMKSEQSKLVLNKQLEDLGIRQKQVALETAEEKLRQLKEKPAETTPEEEKVSDYDQARQIITNNPDKSRAGLFNQIRTETDLSVSDANSLLDEAGVEKEPEASAYLTDDQITKLAISLVKETSKEDALKIADFGKLKINNKNYTLSREQIELLKKAIEKEYPEGRTFWQKALPGGK